jgi:hypothetical protein
LQRREVRRLAEALDRGVIACALHTLPARSGTQASHGIGCRE